MFEYIKDGVKHHSSTGIVQIDETTCKVVNDTMSVYELLFTGTKEECELYLHYYNQHMYRSIIRQYVRNIKDLKIWLMQEVFV